LHAALATEPPSLATGGLYLDALCYPFVWDSSSSSNDGDDDLEVKTIQGFTTYTDRRKALHHADVTWSARLWDVSMALLEQSPAKGVVKLAP
jgi:hypothetical protein